MMNTSLPTHFAPAERLPSECLAGLPERLAQLERLQWLERLPVMVFLANSCRQIVYCNPVFAGALAPELRERFVGLRPGEALGCVYARKMEAGCGCSEYCRHCGAAQAILKSLRGEEDCRECHILASNGNGVYALDLQILSRPFENDGEAMSLNIALDVSHERRLFGLKRTFLHSMINAAGGLDTMFALLDADQGEELLQHVPLLRKSTLSMLQELLYQYDVMAAEAGRLSVQMASYDLTALIVGAVRHISGLSVAQGRDIRTCGPVCGVRTDSRLLRHALGNLVVNALEACPVGERVCILWKREDEGVRIDVENPGTVPEEVAAQFFKRYVSTKGEDRGLGLHTAKVFVENHLGGRLTYAPRPGLTRFSVFLPEPGGAKR